MSEWYPHAVRKNEQDKAWIKKMKWKHFDPTKTNKYHCNQEYRKGVTIGREKVTGNTILLVRPPVMSTTMKRKMSILLVRGGAVVPIMTAAGPVLRALVSVVRGVHRLRGLPHGVNPTSVTITPEGFRLLSSGDDCCHIERSQLRDQFVELNGWMIC